MSAYPCALLKCSSSRSSDSWALWEGASKGSFLHEWVSIQPYPLHLQRQNITLAPSSTTPLRAHLDMHGGTSVAASFNTDFALLVRARQPTSLSFTCTRLGENARSSSIGMAEAAAGTRTWYCEQQQQQLQVEGQKQQKQLAPSWIPSTKTERPYRGRVAPCACAGLAAASSYRPHADEGARDRAAGMSTQACPRAAMRQSAMHDMHACDFSAPNGCPRSDTCPKRHRAAAAGRGARAAAAAPLDCAPRAIGAGPPHPTQATGNGAARSVTGFRGGCAADACSAASRRGAAAARPAGAATGAAGAAGGRPRLRRMAAGRPRVPARLRGAWQLQQRARRVRVQHRMAR
eukprot:352756-Chlamydomonas_euryale.AAC.6